MLPHFSWAQELLAGASAAARGGRERSWRPHPLAVLAGDNSGRWLIADDGDKVVDALQIVPAGRRLRGFEATSRFGRTGSHRDEGWTRMWWSVNVACGTAPRTVGMWQPM